MKTKAYIVVALVLTFFIALIAFDARAADQYIDCVSGNRTIITCGASTGTTLPPVIVAPSTGAWNGTCPGFDATHVITMNWAVPARMLTRNFGSFGVNDAVVVAFTTGGVSTTNNLPRITAGEYDSSPSSRIVALSPTPCDFGPQPTLGSYGEGVSVGMVFAIGTGSGYGYYPVLKTNTTYYMNMKNSPNSTCAGNGHCDMFIDLVKSGGL